MSREPSEEVKLKACPWCGKTPTLTLGDDISIVECENPSCMAAARIVGSNAVSRWNRRVPPESVNADLLAAANEIRELLCADGVKSEDIRCSNEFEAFADAIAKAETGKP